MKLIKHAQYTYQEVGTITIDQDLTDAFKAIFEEAADLTVDDVRYIFDLMRCGVIGWNDAYEGTIKDLELLLDSQTFEDINLNHHVLLNYVDRGYIIFFGILCFTSDWLWEDMHAVEESSELDWVSDEIDLSDEVTEDEEEMITEE